MNQEELPRRVMVLGGPNLNRLGRREPSVYGTTTWVELGRMCQSWGQSLGLEVEFLQEDGEGALVGLIHQASDHAEGLVLNAAAYTHTSVALRDAISAIKIPMVEVHLTNPTAREEFRQKNLLAGVATAGVYGFGVKGYRLALEGLAELLQR